MVTKVKVSHSGKTVACSLSVPIDKQVRNSLVGQTPLLQLASTRSKRWLVNITPDLFVQSGNIGIDAKKTLFLINISVVRPP